MLWFNSCPHCSTGTVEARRDSNGSYLQCLSCSWTLYARMYGRVGRYNEPLPVMAADRTGDVSAGPSQEAA